MGTFNPRDLKNESDAGKISIEPEDKTKSAAESKSGAAGLPSWVKPAAIGGVAIAGLAAVFMMFSGGGDQPVPSQPLPPIVTQPANPPVVTQPQGPTRQQIIAQSVEAKIRAAQDLQSGSILYQAFINASGSEVSRGSDFSTFIGLVRNGTMDAGISVLITEGRYAGIKIGFMPSAQNNAGSMRITYDRVGKIVTGADGKTPQFVLLPENERTHSETLISGSEAMAAARSAGNFPVRVPSVTLPEGTREFEKKDGADTAFWLVGTPEANGGVLKVILWNQDVYAIDLDTGDYSIDSLFTFFPNYIQQFDATGREINVDTELPVVNGRLQVAPGLQPGAPAP